MKIEPFMRCAPNGRTNRHLPRGFNRHLVDRIFTWSIFRMSYNFISKDHNFIMQLLLFRIFKTC